MRLRCRTSTRRPRRANPTTRTPTLLRLMVMNHRGVLSSCITQHRAAIDAVHHPLLRLGWQAVETAMVGHAGRVGVTGCGLHGGLVHAVLVEGLGGHGFYLFRAGLWVAGFDLVLHLVDDGDHAAG